MFPVAEAMREGAIRKGDTLLISPHRTLHLFPLHELVVGDAPLGAQLGIARVANAQEVLRILRNPPSTPACTLAVRVPTSKELMLPGHGAAFGLVTRSLNRSRLPTIEWPRTRPVQRKDLLETLAPRMTAHIMAHGQMVGKGKSLERSFLLLAGPDGLATQGSSDHPPAEALSVSSLLERMNETDGQWLQGSHITLQACVSGYATANPQGDAIGLEWAFLIAGAASTLGTHWMVDWDLAATFSAAFYRAWLVRKCSRVAAWSHAGAVIRKTFPGGLWAAFSLTGDWR
jgi:hypothetical protein